MGLIERPAGTTDEVLRAIAEPNRRAILQLVAREEMAAGDIAAHFSVTRPAISQHLAVLLAAGLVSERRVGTKRLFRARPEGLDDLRAFLAEMWPMALGSVQGGSRGGCQGTGKGRHRTMTIDARTSLTVEQMKAASRRLYVEVFGAGSLDAADEIMAVSCVSHGPGTPPVVGTDPIKQQANLLRARGARSQGRPRGSAGRGRSRREPLEWIRHEHRSTADSGRGCPTHRPAYCFHRDSDRSL